MSDDVVEQHWVVLRDGTTGENAEYLTRDGAWSYTTSPKMATFPTEADAAAAVLPVSTTGAPRPLLGIRRADNAD